MSIKSGELIHVGNTVLVDRAQTAGPGSLNIPVEKIFELGNYQSIGLVRDIPDLKFSLDSLDCSAQLECLLTGQDFSTMADGTAIDISLVRPVDVVSEFKAGKTSTTPFEVEGSVAIPYILTDNLAYKYGLRQNAQQTASLSGDALFYNAGSAYVETTVGTGTANQVVTPTHNVIPYEGDTVNGIRYALSVSLKESGKRLLIGVDYTEAATGAGPAKTVTITVLNGTTETIRVCYQSDTKANYPQASNVPASATRPAALRGRNIEVRIGGYAVSDRWSSVQAVDLTWSVKLERDEEFGNAQVVSQDFIVPDVKGSVEIKPRDVADLMRRVSQVAGVTDGSVVGAQSIATLPLEIILHSPFDGSVLKTLYVPDAQFTLPGFSGKVQTKLTVKFDFESVTGQFFVYKGARPTV